MTSIKNFDVAEHLPLKDFLTRLSNLSDTIEPEMEEMHKIINRTEALGFGFAFRLETLKRPSSPQSKVRLKRPQN